MSAQHATTVDSGYPLESTPASRYQAVKLAYGLNTERLRELEAKGTSAILTEEEAGEMGRLERMLANQSAVMQRLEGEMVFAQQTLDVQAVVETWGGLVSAKLEAYQDFAHALAQLDEAFDGIQRVHAAQEGEVMRLPRKVQERLVFPDGQTLVTRIASRMPNALPWSSLLGGALGLTRGQLAEITDVDPGTRPLSPRAIANFLEGK